MCLDISKPLTKNNGAILEVNDTRDIFKSVSCLVKQREYVADIYIEKLLKDNKCQKIVVIGQSKDDLPTLLRKKSLIKKR